MCRRSRGIKAVDHDLAASGDGVARSLSAASDLARSTLVGRHGPAAEVELTHGELQRRAAAAPRRCAIRPAGRPVAARPTDPRGRAPRSRSRHRAERRASRPIAASSNRDRLQPVWLRKIESARGPGERGLQLAPLPRTEARQAGGRRAPGSIREVAGDADQRGVDRAVTAGSTRVYSSRKVSGGARPRPRSSARRPRHRSPPDRRSRTASRRSAAAHRARTRPADLAAGRRSWESTRVRPRLLAVSEPAQMVHSACTTAMRYQRSASRSKNSRRLCHWTSDSEGLVPGS